MRDSRNITLFPSPKISLRTLGEDDLHLQWTEKDHWVGELVGEALASVRQPKAPMLYRVHLHREGHNVFCKGTIELQLSPLCDRCGKNFSERLTYPFELFFFTETPADAEASAAAETLVGDELDLGPYLKEQTVLALPMGFLCRADCPGLCSKCGADLSTERCLCPPESPDERWAALKNIRVKSKD